MVNKTISHQQIPDGVILNLCDDKGKQLYSPYDTNGNAIKTRCTVTVGEENVLPLPADYITDNEYVDFEAGTYYWQLKFFGNEYYRAYSLPFTVEIRDFKLFEVLNPEIFPNEDLIIKILTPIGTEPTEQYIRNLDDLGYVTTVYDHGTAIISNDFLDINIGQHTETFNQEKNYILNYEIKNPLICQSTPASGNYGTSVTVKAIIAQDSSLEFDSDTYISVNGTYYSLTSRSSTAHAATINNLPPGSYNAEIIAWINDNNSEYTGHTSFQIKTTNCTIDLTTEQNILSEQYPTTTLTSHYLYNNTGINNAKISLINTSNNTVVGTKNTNSNGITTWTVNSIGNYQAIAVDYDNTTLLSSDICHVRADMSEDYIEDININNNANLLVTINTTETPENETLVNTIGINSDGNLVLNIGTGSRNSLKDININNNRDLEYE